ncbi:hypothetical protein GGR54DRAFT_637502 [Hypoxylon sp. NC1633]|nr:hypothetical protein GGR54DRAFT_637502 [Hypoxylon sp. NC1633]
MTPENDGFWGDMALIDRPERTTDRPNKGGRKAGGWRETERTIERSNDRTRGGGGGGWVNVRTIYRTSGRLSDRSNGRLTDQRIDWATERPIERATERTNERPDEGGWREVGRTSERSTGRPIERTNGRTIERPIRATDSSDRSNERTANGERPTGRPTDRTRAGGRATTMNFGRHTTSIDGSSERSTAGGRVDIRKSMWEAELLSKRHGLVSRHQGEKKAGGSMIDTEFSTSAHDLDRPTKFPLRPVRKHVRSSTPQQETRPGFKAPGGKEGRWTNRATNKGGKRHGPASRRRGAKKAGGFMNIDFGTSATWLRQLNTRPGQDPDPWTLKSMIYHGTQSLEPLQGDASRGL